MRHPVSRVRGVLCVLALAMLCSPAVADRKKGKGKGSKAKQASVAACTSFDQLDREEDGVDLVVSSRCDVKLACSVSWSLTCRPAAGKSRKTQHGQAFSLVTDGTEVTNVSPATCGNDGWVIDDVTWACQPEPEPPLATR